MHQACTQNWYKLTPDSNGSYVNGTWSKIASMPSRLRAALLRLPGPATTAASIVNGGEYNQDCSDSCSAVWTNRRRRLQSDHQQLDQRVARRADGRRIGDAQSVVLPNGKYMLANALHHAAGVAERRAR